MWIFTRLGFFSVVAHEDHPDTFMVRARDRQHLANLMRVYGINGPHNVDGIDIVTTPNADYPYRIIVGKGEWQLVMIRLVDDIDYPNFKASIASGEKLYAKLLHEVWGILARGMRHLRPRQASERDTETTRAVWRKMRSR